MNLGERVERLQREVDRREAQRRARLTPEQRDDEDLARLGASLGELAGTSPWDPFLVRIVRAALRPNPLLAVSPTLCGKDEGLAPVVRWFVPTVWAVDPGSARKPENPREVGVWLIAYATALWPRLVGYCSWLASLPSEELRQAQLDSSLTTRRLQERVRRWVDASAQRLRWVRRTRSLPKGHELRAWLGALLDLLGCYRAEVTTALDALPTGDAGLDPQRLAFLWTWAPEPFSELRFRLTEPGESYGMVDGCAFPRWFFDGERDPNADARSQGACSTGGLGDTPAPRSPR